MSQYRSWTTDALTTRAGACALLVVMAASTVAAPDPAPWAVANATVRMKVRVSKGPNHPAAGIIAMVPDGGLLPTPAPGVTVIDSKGKRLKDGCMWHDPERGFALVFATPSDEQAWIYFGRAPVVRAWSPASGLMPSAIAYVKPDAQSLADAVRLARNFPPGRGTYFHRLAGPEIGAIPQGLSGSFTDYIVAYLWPRNPGRTWLAVEPSHGGSLEALVEGRKLRARKAFPQQSGSTGAWFNFTNQPHRVQIYTHRPTEHARLRLAWRPPNATHKELGGDNPKHAGQPMWAARPINASECLNSGTAEVLAIERRDHRPITAFSAEARDYMWLGEAPPLIRYELKARTQDNAEDTRYAWDFGNGSIVKDAAIVSWLFPARTNHTVRLVARNKAGEAAGTFAVNGFCHGHRRASANHPDHRRTYRNVLQHQLEAAPQDHDPTANWTDAHWDVLFNLVDPSEGAALVGALFGPHWSALTARLPTARRWILEDLYFAATAPRQPEQLARVMAQLTHGEKDKGRIELWQLRQVDLLLYYQDNLPAARKLAQAIAASGNSQATRARVRLGDIALLEGRTEDAEKIYGNVQYQVTYREGKVRGEKKSRDPATAVENWRIAAVRRTGASEATRNLIRQKAYTEARRKLAEWELEFPLTKLTDDYLIVEARYLMETGDSVRALKGLAAYCKAVDVTNELPDAMRMTLQCMFETGATRETIDAFATEMKTRFKYHPLGGDIDPILEALHKKHAQKGA